MHLIKPGPRTRQRAFRTTSRTPYSFEWLSSNLRHNQHFHNRLRNSISLPALWGNGSLTSVSIVAGRVLAITDLDPTKVVFIDDEF